MKSILQGTRKCMVCGITPAECHHVFGGANRKNSTKYGLMVWLCHEHHNEPPNGVHFSKEFRDSLQEWAEDQFDTYYPTENFTEIFGKHYET